MLRALTAADWPMMGKLRAERSTHIGTTVSEVTSAPLAAVHKRYLLEPNLALGWFEERLTSFICCYQAEDFWTLDLMISSGNPKQLQTLLEACLQHYEARDVFKMYYAFPQKWARAYKTFWREGAPSLRKYTITDVTVIKPYKVPDEQWIWEHVLHEYVVSVPLLLRLSAC